MLRKRIALLTIAILLSSNAAFAVSSKVANPAKPGPHPVGFTQLPVSLASGGETTLNLWYPATSKSKPTGDTYQTPLSLAGVTQSLSIESPGGMIAGAPIAKGTFPLIVQFHGGGNVQQPNALQGLTHLRINEALASHGFVVAAYTRRNFFLGLDAKAVIDAASQHFPIAIDANNVGVIGEASGNREASALAAGSTLALPDSETVSFDPDPRIKAALYQDGGFSNRTSAEQFTAMTTPYLMLGGSLQSPAAGLDEQFAATTNVSPRIRVTFNTLSHLSMTSGLCTVLDALRGDALAQQLAAGISPLVDPLTNLLPPQIPGGSPAGMLAFLNWNFISVTGQPGLGQSGEFCKKVGIADPLLSSDLDGDGVADAYTGVNAEGDAVLDSETINRLHQRYSVAFFKVHLAGAKRYKRYLTPGYAANDPRVSVEVIGGKGGKRHKSKKRGHSDARW